MKHIPFESEEVDLAHYVVSMSITQTKARIRENEATEDGRKANETLRESLRRREDLRDKLESYRD